MAFGISNGGAFGLSSGVWSGTTTLETLSLEDDFPVLISSADTEMGDLQNSTGSEMGDPHGSAASELVPPSAENIAFHAINPGYNTDAGKNAGELIELVKLADAGIDLGNLSIVYTAKPTAGAEGKSTVLYTFPFGSKMIGRSILLRFRDAPEVSVGSQDLTYDTSIAMYGSLALVQDYDSDNPASISTVCWLGGDGCLPYFSTTVKSRSFTTIVRDDSTGEYYHTNDPVLLFDPEKTGLYLPAEEAMTATEDMKNVEDSPCLGLDFSEVLSYYAEDPNDQFIEFYNSGRKTLNGSSDISLGNCFVRYKNKKYSLFDGEKNLAAGQYFVFRPNPAFRLTKNPTTMNLLEIVDANDLVVSSLSLPHGQKSAASYAFFGYHSDGSADWQNTYNVTPGFPNILQEFKTCPAGKVINELTGNCVNAATISATLKDCGVGKYRNPATGRCKSYDSDDGTADCKEGYERNPETNRCRKIKENNGTDYPLVPITDTEKQGTAIALWIIGGVMSIGIGYIIFQYRKECLYFLRRIIGKIKK